MNCHEVVYDIDVPIQVHQRVSQKGEPPSFRGGSI